MKGFHGDNNAGINGRRQQGSAGVSQGRQASARVDRRRQTSNSCRLNPGPSGIAQFKAAP